jgi:hypothetical protein
MRLAAVVTAAEGRCAAPDADVAAAAAEAAEDAQNDEQPGRQGWAVLQEEVIAERAVY